MTHFSFFSSFKTIALLVYMILWEVARKLSHFCVGQKQAYFAAPRLPSKKILHWASVVSVSMNILRQSSKLITHFVTC